MKHEPKQFIIKKKRGLRDYSARDFWVFLCQVVGLLVLIFIALVLFGLVQIQLPSLSFFGENSEEVNSERLENEERQGYEKITELPYLAPQSVRIPKVDIDTIVEFPESQEIDVLDQALEKGAVHYPGSGTIAQGNIFIFGHSSNWGIVQNQAYKTFNGIEKLVEGDEIILESDGEEYVYIVSSVVLVDDNEALVELGGDRRKLTLSTCNTFGEKQERWVVEAYPRK